MVGVRNASVYTGKEGELWLRECGENGLESCQTYDYEAMML